MLSDSVAFTADDHAHMARALRLARRGLYTTRPNPRVGCVLVAQGRIVGEGYHARAGGPHAEVEALRAAGAAAAGATAYVSLEPCCHFGRTPPCTEALIAAGVARVIYAVADPNPRVAGGGAAQLAAAGIPSAGGLLADDARQLNRGFFARFERARPWVTAKLGMSLDGKVALADGRSQWITSQAARADVQRLRAQADAIMTGVGTVVADDPALTVRDPAFDLGAPPPARIVLDSDLRTPVAARLFAGAGEIRLFTRSADVARRAALTARGAVLEDVASAVNGLSLSAVLARLAALEINEVLVEAGPTLLGQLLDAGLIDELVLYVAPMVLGAGARSAFPITPPASLDAAVRFVLVEDVAIGPDRRLVLRPRAA